MNLRSSFTTPTSGSVLSSGSVLFAWPNDESVRKQLERGKLYLHITNSTAFLALAKDASKIILTLQLNDAARNLYRFKRINKNDKHKIFCYNPKAKVNNEW